MRLHGLKERERERTYEQPIRRRTSQPSPGRELYDRKLV